MRKLLMMGVLAVFACGVNAHDLLWDQWGTAENGFASQDFETAYDCYDCWAADDFHVRDDWPGFYVQDIHWDAYFSYGQATVRQVNFYIWPTRADGMADFYNPIWIESGFRNQTLYTGENQYEVYNPVCLFPGTTYFLGVQVQMDFTTWGQHLWTCQAREYYGQDFNIINPNGGHGMGSDWFAPEPGYEANFRLYGFVPEPGVVSLAGLLLGVGALRLRRR